jgi:Bacterial Ig-like domain (group 3)
MTSILRRPSRLLFALLASVALLGAGVVDASATTTVPTQTTLVVTVTSPLTGQQVKLKTVVTENPGTALPTGTVTFSDSGTPIGSPVALTNVAGKMVAILTTTFTAGSHTLLATYNGDTGNAGSSSPTVPLTVGQASTLTTVTAAQRTAPGAYRIAALVTVVKPGVGVPTGNATFTIDGAPTIVALDVNGHAHVDLSFTVGTSHTVTVVYSGDSNFITSTSSQLTFVAAIGGGFTAVPSFRLLDTRPTPIAPGATRSLTVLGFGGVPVSGISAVELNVTVTQGTSSGFITAYAGGTTRPTASNLNFTKGQTIANLVVAQVGGNGTVSLYNGSTGSTQLIVDVEGYYAAGVPSLPGAFGPLMSTRLLDTRHGAPVAAGGTIPLSVLGVGAVPATGVSAVLLNVTSAQGTEGGFVTVFADGPTRPTASNLNYGKGQTIANLVVAQVNPSTGKVDFYNGSTGTTNLIADVEGYFLTGPPTASGAFGSVPSFRALDTRKSSPVAALGVVQLTVAGVDGIPATGVSAVVFNLTATQGTSSGVITAYADGTTKPTASNLNFTKGLTIPNLVVVPVGADGKVTLYNGSAGTTELIADLAGYYLQ